MSQRDLAIAIGREHGMIARIELGERRVDFVEAFQLFSALGANPAEEASRLMMEFAAAIALGQSQRGLALDRSTWDTGRSKILFPNESN